MRHLKAGKKLSRNATHRLALYRNLTMALIRHERIITTLPKAKAVRPFVEKLITLARRNTLHARRLVVARLGPMASAEVEPNPAEGEEYDGRSIVQKLFEELGPRFKDRPGGYTRVIKRHERRLGDAGETAFLELLQEGEVKVHARAPSVAPRIEEQPAEETEKSEAPAGETPVGETPAAETASSETAPAPTETPPSTEPTPPKE